ncbi:MAG: MATE family efflux transporter, partial [Pseudomonadota bacterium]
LGLGFAAMSLVSEALGRRDPQEASRWAWQTVQIALITVAGVAVVLVSAPALVLGIFTDEAAVIDAGVLPLRVLGVVLLAEGVSAVMQNALTGAGAARKAAAVSVLSQWGLGLPCAALFGLALGGGVLGVWLGWSLSRLAAASVLTAIWARGRWTAIKL